MSSLTRASWHNKGEICKTTMELKRKVTKNGIHITFLLVVTINLQKNKCNYLAIYNFS